MIQRRGPAQDLRATIDRLPLHVRQAVLDGIKSQRIIAGAHADASGGVCLMVAADVHLPWQSVNKSSVATAQQAALAWDRYAEAGGASHTATKRQLLALTAMLEASILQDTEGMEIPFSGAIAEYEDARSGRVAPFVPPARGADVPVTGTRYLSLADAYEVPAEDLPSTVGAPVQRPRVIEAPVEIPSFVEEPGTDVVEPIAAQAVEPIAAQAPEIPVARPSRQDMPIARPSSRPRRDTGERDRSSELEERDGWAWMRPFRSYDEYEETLLRALSELDSHERELEELKAR